ncbi:hypothetical protein DB30_06880 [Enhygromyxa salina]|uniref:Uncharacterized protein n=1 Tax=Enhygromyxa salina TaxID=215803 RepID=A0A0C2CXN7_9BACT|nr:hypothetical protein DB30_06880 [Enhygromyxa salina]
MDDEARIVEQRGRERGGDDLHDRGGLARAQQGLEQGVVVGAGEGAQELPDRATASLADVRVELEDARGHELGSSDALVEGLAAADQRARGGPDDRRLVGAQELGEARVGLGDRPQLEVLDGGADHARVRVAAAEQDRLEQRRGQGQLGHAGALQGLEHHVGVILVCAGETLRIVCLCPSGQLCSIWIIHVSCWRPCLSRHFRFLTLISTSFRFRDGAALAKPDPRSKIRRRPNRRWGISPRWAAS